jgi:hypothetical protein
VSGLIVCTVIADIAVVLRFASSDSPEGLTRSRLTLAAATILATIAAGILYRHTGVRTRKSRSQTVVAAAAAGILVPLMLLTVWLAFFLWVGEHAGGL